MGRRALPKLDPTLDLARHLKTVDELPQPWDAGALFAARDAPLEVEVGSGKGLFLQSAATALPDHNFLGIEVAQKYAHHTAARLAKRNLTNAVIVHGDAQRVFRELLPDDSLAAVHVYFPDPWWKKRHRKRRVMNEAFLEGRGPHARARRTIPFLDRRRGVFPVRAWRSSPSTRRSSDRSRSRSGRPEHDLDFRTHFERRMRLAELPVYRSEFRKES